MSRPACTSKFELDTSPIVSDKRNPNRTPSEYRFESWTATREKTVVLHIPFLIWWGNAVHWDIDKSFECMVTSTLHEQIKAKLISLPFAYGIG